MLWRASAPMTARAIADALVADKARAARKQAIDLQAASLAALRKRDGAMVGWRGRARPVAVVRQLRRAGISSLTLGTPK
jgi:hypothetical protein